MSRNINPDVDVTSAIEKQLEFIVVSKLIESKGMRSITIHDMVNMLTGDKEKNYEQRFSGEKLNAKFRNRLSTVFQQLVKRNIFFASRSIAPLKQDGHNSDIRGKRYTFLRPKLLDYYHNVLIEEVATQLSLEVDTVNQDGFVQYTIRESKNLLLTEDERDVIAQEIWKISRANGEI